MLSTFGAKAALAVLINALVLTYLFRRELSEHAAPPARSVQPRVPAAFVIVHLVILAAVVFTNHESAGTETGGPMCFLASMNRLCSTALLQPRQRAVGLLAEYSERREK